MTCKVPYLMVDTHGSILCNDLGAPIHLREAAAHRLEHRMARGTVVAVTVIKRKV